VNELFLQGRRYHRLVSAVGGRKVAEDPSGFSINGMCRPGFRALVVSVQEPSAA